MPTKTVMLKMVEAFGTGDFARVDQFVSPDYVDHQGLGEGEVLGASGFANVVQVARRAVSGLEVRIEDVITEDDRAAARINWQGSICRRPNARARDDRHHPSGRRQGGRALGGGDVVEK
jgi:predicted ester cyclase